MEAKIKYSDYEEYPMRLHNFLRGILMPMAFIAMMSLLYFHSDAYAADLFLVPECAMCVAGILLIIISEFGFFYYASYAYYAVLWFMVNSLLLSFYSFAYLQHQGFSPDLKIKLPDRTIDLPDITMLLIGLGVAAWFIWSIAAYVYYRRRKFMFVATKEDKRMQKGNLKAQEIDFDPKFEREKMSRSELKEHMNKRFEIVDGEQKEERPPEANPFE